MSGHIAFSRGVVQTRVSGKCWTRINVHLILLAFTAVFSAAGYLELALEQKARAVCLANCARPRQLNTDYQMNPPSSLADVPLGRPALCTEGRLAFVGSLHEHLFGNLECFRTYSHHTMPLVACTYASC